MPNKSKKEKEDLRRFKVENDDLSKVNLELRQINENFKISIETNYHRGTY